MGVLEAIRSQPFDGFLDAAIAYTSVSVFFDPVRVYQSAKKSPHQFVSEWLDQLAKNYQQQAARTQGRELLLPVCYDPQFAPDLEAMAAFHHCSTKELIELHHSQSYYVFMIGFSPGFPYLGILPDALVTPRKSSPAPLVRAGSVGIAGRQTGIYPMDSPGGWNIIGRTPTRLFDIGEKQPCFFKAGDRVRFSPIDLETFNYLNQYAAS